jgi:hypothetical protein
MRRSIFAVSAILALGACQPRVIVQDRIKTISVPVSVGCVAGERPEAVQPLRVKIGDAAWKALTARQKTDLVGAQALSHQSQGQGLGAATAGCK